jgi:hypothetical protein
MNECRLGTSYLNDDDFILAFERCEIPGEHFHHADHLRLARLYVDRFGPEVAEWCMLKGIRKFAEHHGATQKFHYTMTVAWLRLVAFERGTDRAADAFEPWVARHQSLLRRDLLSEHYSKDCLDSQAARGRWVEPDLRPIP